MLKGGTLLLMLFLCFTPFLHLQGQGLAFSFHQLSREQGLGYSTDYFVSRDRYGFIWIGTEEGLNRFDGQRIEHYAPESGDVQVTSRCFEDANGNLWFSTFSAVHCYRRATGRIQSFPADLPDVLDFHAFFLDTKQLLWLKAGSGDKEALFCFNTHTGNYQRLGPITGKRCTMITNSQGEAVQVVSTMLPQNPGMVITQLRNWKSDTIQFNKLPNGEPRRASPTKNAWLEGDSVLWVGLYNGLGKYDLKQGSISIELDRTDAVSPDVGWMHDMIPYDANRLLVACGEGLLVFDKRSRRFVQQFRHNPKVPFAIAPGEITQLFRDPSNQIWLSGAGGGIAFAHLFKTKFSSIPETAGASITSMFQDKNGRVWCGTSDSGAYLFNREATLLLRSRSLDNKAQPGVHFNLPGISTFWEDEFSGLWGFSGNNALHWQENSRIFDFQQKNFFGVATAESDNIRLHTTLSDGTRLASRGKEIFGLKTKADWVLFQSWKDLYALGLQQVTAVFQSSNGLVFVADNHFRILALDTGGGVARKVAEWTDTGNCLSFLDTGDSLLWAASSKGLFCINLRTMEGQFRTESSGGVPTERYYNILPDRNGNLWLTGNNGLIRFDPQLKSWHRFGTADGLFSGIFTPNAALIEPTTGRFWVGGKNGVNVFNPDEVHLLDVAPEIHFTRLLVNDTVFHTGQDLCLLDRLDLDYTQNTLSFQFAALDFSAPGQNLYYYRLKGIERDSVSNGTQGFVRYSNVPAGDYTFEVWATNSDGMVSAQPRRLQVHIRPPFWQTWWFYLLSLATVAGLIYAWFQYRLKQALKIERMRVQISSDLHDDVGTLLSGLAMQSEVLELTATDKDRGKLRRIGEISRDAMARMRDTVWAIDARKDKLENLIDRMREYAEETLAPRGIRFHIEAEQLSGKLNLPTHIRQNLYLIYKEAVTNAAKHSNGDTLTAGLKKTPAGFEMRICDNGTVKKKVYKTTGLGTSNMQMRAEKIGGTLDISREDGYCVVLRLPGRF